MWRTRRNRKLSARATVNLSNPVAPLPTVGLDVGVESYSTWFQQFVAEGETLWAVEVCGVKGKGRFLGSETPKLDTSVSRWGHGLYGDGEEDEDSLEEPDFELEEVTESTDWQLLCEGETVEN